MKVEAIIINPEYKKAIDQLEYDLKHYLFYNPCETYRNRMHEIRLKHAKHLTIRGEMVSQDFDKFECVVLAEDGTYHKVSLDNVKVIKEEEK